MSDETRFTKIDKLLLQALHNTLTGNTSNEFGLSDKQKNYRALQIIKSLKKRNVIDDSMVYYYATVASENKRYKLADKIYSFLPKNYITHKKNYILELEEIYTLLGKAAKESDNARLVTLLNIAQTMPGFDINKSHKSYEYISGGYEGRKLIHIAAAGKSVGTVALLIEKGADVNAKIDNGRTPIYEVNNIEVAKYLMGVGADIGAKTDSGGTPLILAVWEGKNREIVDLFINEIKKKKLDINEKSNYGITALHYSGFHDAEIAKLLIDNGADPNIVDKLGKTPLHWSNSMDVTKVMVENGGYRSIAVKNKEGLTPMEYSFTTPIYDWQTDLLGKIDYLKSLGAEINPDNIPMLVKEVVSRGTNKMLERLLQEADEAGTVIDNICEVLSHARKEEKRYKRPSLAESVKILEAYLSSKQ